MFRKVGLCLSVLAIGSLPAALAQDPGLVSVLDIHVQPGHGEQYESAITKLWAAFKKTGVATPITVSTSADEPNTYTFVAQVASFAEFGTLRDSVNKAFASVPQVMAELQGMTMSQDQSIWAPRPDLSYVPANPRLKDSEMGFTRVVFLYPQPNQVPAFEAALLAGVATRKKHGITDGTNVGQLVIGPNAPAYAILVGAKDEADSYAQQAKNVEKMGADWQAYVDKLESTERHLEISGATALPALSYQP
jgi:hypothetical protein